MSKLTLKQQIERFCKSGFKRHWFTEDIYRMLYIDTNVFIAHYNRDNFYEIRFKKNAEATIDALAVVKKPELREFCHSIAASMELRLDHKIFVQQHSTVITEKQGVKK